MTMKRRYSESKTELEEIKERKKTTFFRNGNSSRFQSSKQKTFVAKY